ncbi:MAG TPA: class II fructose-bisphosphate aldolase [Chitinophagaceae bacterium]|jgi:fructose-bisphosphate aldolase class II/tagatose 1,6-diphosphate aldolase GatY/KbaY|nr:class II fructose-bisphosphate aldolase [Chitinophagaceae bacterium]
MTNNITLQEKFKTLQQQNEALLATNFYNFETLKGVLQAARSVKKPIILQLTKNSLEYLGIPVAVELARSMLKYYEVEGWIHLDHGDSYDLVAGCLDAGFDSVMIDASEQPFEENVRITRSIVRLAEKYGVNVEAELGYIAKLGQKTDKIGFTQPGDAKRFVDETGVNALAVAIGSAHGFYKDEPKIDLDRLAEIRKATNAALVLHGASGIPHPVLRDAVKRGICKINLATEIKNIFMKTLKNALAGEDEIDLRKVFPRATDAVTELVRNKLQAIQIESNTCISN